MIAWMMGLSALPLTKVTWTLPDLIEFGIRTPPT
jgi:hypothetical protein